MDTSFVKTAEVQHLLDRAAGVDVAGGNQRLKAITRDLIESLMVLIVSTTFPKTNSGRRPIT